MTIEPEGGMGGSISVGIRRGTGSSRSIRSGGDEGGEANKAFISASGISGSSSIGVPPIQSTTPSLDETISSAIFNGSKNKLDRTRKKNKTYLKQKI